MCVHIHMGTQTASIPEFKIPHRVKNTLTGRKIQSNNLSGRLEVIQSNTDTSITAMVCVCVFGGTDINLCLEVKLIRRGYTFKMMSQTPLIINPNPSMFGKWEAEEVGV